MKPSGLLIFAVFFCAFPTDVSSINMVFPAEKRVVHPCESQKRSVSPSTKVVTEAEDTHSKRSGLLALFERFFKGQADTESEKPKEPEGMAKYSNSFLRSMPPPGGGKEWRCMREAIYYEARGEELRGQFAVAEVVMNRVESPKYPNTVCGVVRQRNSRGVCQFSFYCDGIPERLTDSIARDRSGRIARLMLDGGPRALTSGATHFHARSVHPKWAMCFEKTASIGHHIFYRAP